MSTRSTPPGPSGRTTGRSTDAVPLVERLRVTQLLRLAAGGLLLLCAALAPDTLVPYRREAVVATLVYLGVVGLGEAFARALPGRLFVFSTLLILDGVWLAWATYLTGSLGSPVRYLVLLHVAAVALIASYRTGLKIAMWHSLLLYGSWNAQLVPPGAQAGVLPATGGGSTSVQELAVFITVLWLVTISTSALSAVNERELRRRRGDLEALTDPGRAARARGRRAEHRAQPARLGRRELRLPAGRGARRPGRRAAAAGVVRPGGAHRPPARPRRQQRGGGRGAPQPQHAARQPAGRRTATRG